MIIVLYSTASNEWIRVPRAIVTHTYIQCTLGRYNIFTTIKVFQTLPLNLGEVGFLFIYENLSFVTFFNESAKYEGVVAFDFGKSARSEILV